MTDWRDIPGHPGYQASDDGRVRSVDRTVINALGVTRTLKSVVLKPARDRGGYSRVSLGLVHRLVCMAFHGLPADPKLHAAHLDGDNQNNRPANLYWATVAENNRDVVRHGRNWNANKTHCIRGHELTPDARRCRQCHRERCRAYKQRNPEKVRASALAYYYKSKGIA
jgi:hypothetical protein